MSTKHRPKDGNRTGKSSLSNREYRAASRSMMLFVAAAVLFLGGLTWLSTTHPHRAPNLNAQGLRVSGAGRSDATRVVPPAQFADLRAKNAYRIAAEISATLNKLYCWCGCIERGMRSNLECFESTHAAQCDVCLAGAEVAWEMRQKGITDPAQVQRVLDARFAPPST